MRVVGGWWVRVVHLEGVDIEGRLGQIHLQAHMHGQGPAP